MPQIYQQMMHQLDKPTQEALVHLNGLLVTYCIPLEDWEVVGDAVLDLILLGNLEVDLEAHGLLPEKVLEIYEEYREYLCKMPSI